MPTTLIFGASRGLGRAFTDHALQLGHRVVALVRHADMASGCMPWESRSSSEMPWTLAVTQACPWRAGMLR